MKRGTMKPLLKLGLLCCLPLLLTVVGSIYFAGRGGAEPNVIRAHAIVPGPTGVSGTVYFTESPVDKYTPVSEVQVVADIDGLSPGFHGMHLHEIGTCDPPAFTTSGGHFDPGPFGNSTPVDANHPYHVGDLPAIEANDAGHAHREYTSSRFTLRQNAGNALSLFDANGSSVVIHQQPDLGATGVPTASGGPRIACGVIQLDGGGPVPSTTIDPADLLNLVPDPGDG
jgi:superoxide dismutase, Cu-Zn family